MRAILLLGAMSLALLTGCGSAGPESGSIGRTSPAAGGRHWIEGCKHPARRCVFDTGPGRGQRDHESASEARAANDLDRISRLTDVVCSRRGPRRFSCGGSFHEQAIDAGLEVGIESNRHGMYSIRGCRITRLRPGSASAFACQHLTWDVGHLEAMLEAMATNGGRSR